jgi:hypothetical protein
MISFAKIMRQVLTEKMSFRDLLRVSEPGRIKRGRNDVTARSIRVKSEDNQEIWAFNYKSDPSTTGNRWHGYVRFFKEDVSQKDNAEDLYCQVDCDCPDFRYRYAYNNAVADVTPIGADSINKNNGKKWRPRSQGGVGDYGVGLCKHLCALSEYLKTKIEPVAPEPEDKISPITKPPTKPQLPVSQKPPTVNAPKPEDTYTDTRSGTLQEQRSSLYERIDQFVKSNPEFEVQYEEDPT